MTFTEQPAARFADNERMTTRHIFPKRIFVGMAFAIAAFSVPAVLAAPPSASTPAPIDWIVHREDKMAFVVPRGWQVQVDEEKVFVVDPGSSGACFLLKEGKSQDPVNANDVVSRMLAAITKPEILEQVNGNRHASFGAKKMVDGKPHWMQAIADVSRPTPSEWSLAIVVFETMDLGQYAQFTGQESTEVFLSSLHSPMWPPADVLRGIWEGSEGTASRRIARSRSGQDVSLDDGWYFRLELLEGRQYRLTRVLTSTAPIVAGWSATTETGTFESEADVVTLHRRACSAARAPGGAGVKTGPCGPALGALVFEQRSDADGLVTRGVHLFDDRWGAAEIALHRPIP